MSEEQDPAAQHLAAVGEAVVGGRASEDPDVHLDDAARDADADTETDTDAGLDEEIDRLDDGAALVGTSSPARSEALPFMMSAREHFAAVGDVEVTGDARVDAATARLEEVPDLPTADHVAVYDDVHRRLQDALSDADVR